MTKRIQALVVVLLILTGFWVAWKEHGAAQQPASRELVVQVDQLPAPWNDLVPLKCRGTLATPNEIKTLSCVLSNNTSKYIEAGALSISVVLETNGPVSTPSVTLSFDTFLHPDFRAEHPHNSIRPGGEYQIEDAASVFDKPVSRITVTLDYIEFSDGSTAGPDHSGSIIINAQREGARKYKDWLGTKYRATRSMAIVSQLIGQDGNLPVEAGISNGNEEQGARIFRRQQRRLYETKGAETLRHYLQRSGN